MPLSTLEIYYTKVRLFFFFLMLKYESAVFSVQYHVTQRTGSLLVLFVDAEILFNVYFCCTMEYVLIMINYSLLPQSMCLSRKC